MIRFIITACLLAAFAQVKSQGSEYETNRTTLYKDFLPSEITMTNGKVIKQRHTNIFLRTGALLYKRGALNMKASMQNIARVDFPDATYIKVDTMLAMVIDTCGADLLLCATLIDMQAFRQNLINSNTFTDVSIGDQVGATTVSSMSESDMVYPLKHVYIYYIDGEYIEVDERNLRKHLSKDKRRAMAGYMHTPGFEWTNRESLKGLLAALGRN